ncbi:MAG: 23S rRNA pseudouridine1911/1915/1917 synthase [Pirellulaceae bacterium]
MTSSKRRQLTAFTPLEFETCMPDRFAKLVLYEDNHLLVVNKPAPLATMGAEAGEPTLLEQAKQYLKEKYSKPGNVYLGVVSRLDAFVTGAIVLARTSKAASRLSDQFRRNDVEKVYWALTEGEPSPAADAWEDWVHKNDSLRRMEICSAKDRDAKQARLRYQVLERVEQGCLVRVELETGRKHQIRVQFSSRGLAILGDRKYSGRLSFPVGIGLHSRYLNFKHPIKNDPVAVTASLPYYWKNYGDWDGN